VGNNSNTSSRQTGINDVDGNCFGVNIETEHPSTTKASAFHRNNHDKPSTDLQHLTPSCGTLARIQNQKQSQSIDQQASTSQLDTPHSTSSQAWITLELIDFY
jgi:hypothetical protein